MHHALNSFPLKFKMDSTTISVLDTFEDEDYLSILRGISSRDMMIFWMARERFRLACQTRTAGLINLLSSLHHYDCWDEISESILLSFKWTLLTRADFESIRSFLPPKIAYMALENIARQFWENGRLVPGDEFVCCDKTTGMFEMHRVRGIMNGFIICSNDKFVEQWIDPTFPGIFLAKKIVEKSLLENADAKSKELPIE